MGKLEKTLDKIIRGTSDANIAFDDICRILRRLGFDERIPRGSGKAKPYQVKQVRNVLVKYKLGGRL